MFSLREKQIGALKQMLNLNQSQSKTAAAEPVWKILIYDRCGQDIISPLISVKELRELGVTLHVQLHSDRDPIPDVPAVYFCLPTEENLGRIGQDLQNNLYDIYHLNFISPISRQRIEDLASAALQANCVSQIHKVYDQYLNFITLEDDMFILKHQNSDLISYYAINRGEIKDTEMENIMDTIVDSLFSVFATLGTVPIIRSPRGNAAEMVAEKLDKKLRENLRDTRNSLFLMDASQAGYISFQRPLLIVLDRNVDMATPLHHTWTYQALVHDVLDLSLNRVVVEENMGRSPAGGARVKTRACDLDSRDKFWVTHKGSPFPIVAEAIQEELEQYRSSEDEVKKLKESMGIDNESDAAFSMVSDNTAKLTSAVNSLPQLLEKKRLIDMHTTIATAILNSIKTRRLDTLFECEEKVMSKATLDRSIMELLTDPEAGTSEDKMRLFIIYYICTHSMSEAEFDRYAAALQNAGCDLQPLTFIKRWKAYAKMAATPNQYVGGGTKTVSMFSKLVTQGSSFVMEGVKNLVIKRHNLPVTRIVDELMEMKNSQEIEDYRYFDPKQLRMTDSSQIPRNRTPFQEAIVFIVGGGNYIEYQNLVDYTKSKTGGSTGKRVIYGASTLNNAKQFLTQLSLLGQEIH
ncbi:protein sly1 homolog [Anabrus simplex]|uniref:protein sly1 homolog n=1 Tax=Anabrus simplex TaxID=316456 RepID=UPI0034DD98DC